jgi:hypothetical protein
VEVASESGAWAGERGADREQASAASNSSIRRRDNFDFIGEGL